MTEKVALDKAWAEAARRCRLSPADVRMAKELGFKPRSLLQNQPSPQQPWKAPVAEWVRDLYAKRQRRSEQRRQRRERAQEAMVDLRRSQCKRKTTSPASSLASRGTIVTSSITWSKRSCRSSPNASGASCCRPASSTG